MAKNLFCYTGGLPIFSLPNENAIRSVSQDGADLPTRVGAEYSHGYFTLSGVLNYKFMPDQRDTVIQAKAKVDDIIFVACIPSETWIDDVAVRVRDADKTQLGTVYQPVAVEFKIQSDGTIAESGSVIFKKNVLSTVSPSTNSFQAVAPDKNENFGDSKYFVPTGSVVMLGFKIVSTPTDNNQTIQDSDATIEIMSHIRCYDSPLQF